MMLAVKSAIEAVVARHFPAATPCPIEETNYAFGIGRTTVEGENACRIIAPVRNDEDMYPGYLHYCFNLTPADITQDSALRSAAWETNQLQDELNLLFTGDRNGQSFTLTASKNSDGKPTSFVQHQKIWVTSSEQYPEGGLNILMYYGKDGFKELYFAMRKNMRMHPELQGMMPSAGHRLS